MTLITRFSLCVLLLCLSLNRICAQQGIFGVLTDELGDPVIGGNVQVWKGDTFIVGTVTDFDGNYRIQLDPGEYNVEFTYVEHTKSRIEGVEVPAAKETKLDFKFSNEPLNFEVRRMRSCGSPIIRLDETTQGMTIYSDELRRVSKPN